MSSLHTAIPTPSFCSFWHGHPYIPIHFLKMFFILYNSRLLCSHAVLEIVTVVISNGNFKCCISLFYRPPNSLVSVDNIFQEYLESIDISRFSLFVLLGDFNINV